MSYSECKEWFNDVVGKSLYNTYYKDAILAALSRKWEAKAGNVTFAEGEEEALNVIKKNWVKSLTTKQKEFVERLASGRSFLLCERRNHFSESSILTSSNAIISANDFLKISTTAFRLNNEKNYKEESWLKGKIAEIVTKYQLADLLTEVDYNFYPNSGDGGVDFKLVDSPDIGIQVKTRWSRDYRRISDAKWSFKQTEIESNQVFLCLLLLSSGSIDELQVVLAGFTIKNLLSSKQDMTISWNDLLYCGGLRNHLLYLQTKDPGFLICDLKAEEYFNCAISIEQINELETPSVSCCRLLESLYSKAIEVDKKNYRLYNRRSIVYQKMQDHLAALDDLNSAIQVEPKFIQGYMNRAFVHDAMQQYQQILLQSRFLFMACTGCKFATR